MGKALKSLIIIGILNLGSLCYSQTSVKVSDPRLEMIGNTIHIYYDIGETNPGDRYDVSIDIKDENGEVIDAKSLAGDIGVVEQAGNNKQITWNLEADNIYLDAYVFVQINAKVITTGNPVIQESVEKTEQVILKQEDLSDDTPSRENVQQAEQGNMDNAETTLPSSTSGSKGYSRTGIILQSLAVPGLGLSRVTGKPHWLRAVAGYGCVAGSVVLDQLANNTYDGIQELEYFDEINNAYDKAIRQESTSYIFLYAAAGIWVMDLIWNIVGTSDSVGESLYSHSDGFSLGSSVDPLSRIPLMSIRYRF